MALMLATDTYDLIPRENLISVTTLMNSTRKNILSQRVEVEEDVSDLISSQIGSAIHTALEAAWINPEKALKKLGYTDAVISRIAVNPSEINKDKINVWTEKRTEREWQGMYVSGCADLILDGRIHDYKTTSAYVYMNQTNFHKYRIQLSIYRWLNQDIVNQDVGTIHYYIRDWNKHDCYKAGYPQSAMPSQDIALMSFSEVEQYVTAKINLLQKYANSEESALPLCSSEDLWQDKPKYQYFSSTTSQRATKNFDSEAEAYAHMNSKGKGIVKLKQGLCKACNFCPAVEICSQAKNLKLAGLL